MPKMDNFFSVLDSLEKEIKNKPAEPQTCLLPPILENLSIKTVYISKDSESKSAVQHLLNCANILGLDIETAKLPEYLNDKQAGLSPRKSKIRLVQLYDGQSKVFVFDLFKLKDHSCLNPIWKRPLVAHNAMFEMQHLLNAGWKPEKLGCSLLADVVLSGLRRNLNPALGLSRSASLKALSKELLDLEISKDNQKSDWSSAELSQVQIDYAALDAVLAFNIFQGQYPQLKSRGLVKAYALMRDAQFTLSRAMLNGIGFNVKEHSKLVDAWQIEVASLKAELLKELGSVLNINSSKQLSNWIKENIPEDDLETWQKTATERFSTAAGVLKAKQKLHVVLPKITAYKKVNHRTNSFGNKLYRFVDLKSERLYGSFTLTETVTGRLSGREPNLQQMPREGFRHLFRAKEGFSLLGLDYGQQEIRIAALLSQDTALLSVFKEGRDIHVATAAALTGTPADQIKKHERQLAKAVNFGLLYGQGARGLRKYAKDSYSVDMTEQEAEQHKKKFFNTYPQLKTWQRLTANKAERAGIVKTPGGRERDFTRETYGFSFNASLNHPVQGAAAEIMLHVLKQLGGVICADCLLVNIIHDEILLEVRSDLAESYLEKARVIMEAAFLKVFPDSGPYLKDVVEGKTGRTWAEAK